MNNTRNLVVFLLLLLLVVSRFVGLDWGLPFPMHPDERNMVIAITQMSCEHIGTVDCLNPNFFAYGQLPLYLGFFLSPFISLAYEGNQFEHAALALRLISALASILTVIMLIKTVTRLVTLDRLMLYSSLLFFTFIPAFIQFSHFGTTESLLMLFYIMLMYIAVGLLQGKTSLKVFIRNSGIVFGVALGTKVSALAFGAIPALALLWYVVQKKDLSNFFQVVYKGAILLLISGSFFLLTSPFSMIRFEDFLGSMQYESSVGFGEYRAFYTRQFEYTIPVIFQFVSVFPYSLGWGVFTAFMLGFVALPYNKLNNFLRLQFLLFFIPNSLFYAKWTRFSSPIFPLMALFAFLMVVYVYLLLKKHVVSLITQRTIVMVIILFSIVPGIAYSLIYYYQDVRFEASEWIFKNMPAESYILSETANVIDVPIVDPDNEELMHMAKPYTYISFNFYEMHNLDTLNGQLEEHIQQADYIFIPSRRVFANHTCYVPIQSSLRIGGHTKFKIQNSFLGYESDRCAKLRSDYPDVNAYYDRLFSGELGFEQVAEFTSYPRIELFGKTLIEFPDEMAEETWTVFDHPVIRIYKRV